MKRYICFGLLALLLAASLVLASCAGSSSGESAQGNGEQDAEDHDSMSGSQTMGSFDEEKPFDLQFIDQMIIHHQGAIMSAENMIADSKRPELRQLAENIQKSQAEQIEQMRTWREQWYPDAGPTFQMDPTQMDEMMGDKHMQQMTGDEHMQQMMGSDATDGHVLADDDSAPPTRHRHVRAGTRAGRAS